MKLFKIFILCLFVPAILSGQNQNPPSLKWMQVKTPHFKVVFPENIQTEGLKTAAFLEKTYNPASSSLKTEVKKIPVFLFNQSTVSNGYTTLAPRHMGFYTTPPQDALLAGGTDWMQILTIHEFRHAVQFQKLDQNLNLFFSSLFGDFGRAFCMNVSIPLWVFEGDAVCTETIYSSEGRGRLPSFTSHYRALETEGIRTSYYKAYLGSYKDYIPNHYHLGYLMTSFIRNEYGDEIWSKIIDRTTWASFYPFIFSNSLKYYTGNSLSKTYRNCMNKFDTLMADEAVVPNTNFTSITSSEPKLYASYEYPFTTDEGSIIALKYSLTEPPTLVILEKSKERKLLELNPVDRIHSNGKEVVWSSITADIRWGQRTYSDILIYELSTGILKTLTAKGKYFAPAVSPDGSKIAAIRYGDDMICSLIVLNSNNGAEEFCYTFAKGQFARMPSWSADGNRIVLVVTSGQQRNISVVNIVDNSLSQATPNLTESITNPVFSAEYILFNTVYNNTDMIQALDPKTSERYIVATGNFGVYNASISNDRSQLVFQNYTTKGNDIVVQEIDRRDWKKVGALPENHFIFSEALIKQEKASPLFDTMDYSIVGGIEPYDYHPLYHSLNVHSWSPVPITNGIRLSVYSNDILNTTSLKAGIDYFTEDAALREFFELEYGRFFPVFDIGFSYGQNYTASKDTAGETEYVKLFENVISTGITIPLDFSRHIYNTTLSIGTGFNYIYQRYPESGPAHEAGSFDISVVEFNLNFSRTRQSAFRDINPRFSQEINFNSWNAPFGDEKGESRYILNGRFTFPGLARHHSLTLSGGIENNTPEFRNGVYKLTGEMEYIRGYDRDTLDNLSRVTIEYTLPIAYPDLELGGLFFLKRISTNLFYDHGLVNYQNDIQQYNSLGIDLNFDFHLFSNLLPFQAGIRYSYRLYDQKYNIEILIFGVSF
jgi:hypothetical protein